MNIVIHSAPPHKRRAARGYLTVVDASSSKKGEAACRAKAITYSISGWSTCTSELRIRDTELQTGSQITINSQSLYSDRNIMESSALSIQSKGDSPRDMTTSERRDFAATSPNQESRSSQRRPTKLSKQHRHMPYDRSPGGSTCTSSDESNGEQDHDDENLTVEQKRLKRMAANCRERKRMHTVNSAFDELRELVPTYPTNRKLSKIDTLRLACAYIEDLTSLLRNPSVVHGEDVKLYHPQCPEGFVQGCGSPPSAGYPGVQVKAEYSANGDFTGCNYQQYRVHPAPGYFSVSLCVMHVRN